MTQSELADKLNLTRQTISKYERGESFPDMSILMSIADVFAIPVDSLIQAGGPTKTESQMLLHNSSTDIAVISEVLNIAPFLKPSVLDKLVEPLQSQGIDISHIIELAEYMNAKSVDALAESTDFTKTDPELIKRLIPVLNEESKFNIFERVLEGELDWRFIDMLVPYIEYIRPLVDAAILEGFCEV